MGLVELVLAFLAVAAGLAVLIPWALIAAKATKTPRSSRAPLPLLPTAAALLAFIAGPLLGAALAGPMLEHVLLPTFQGIQPVVVTDPVAPLASRLHAGAVLALWLALPGLLASCWLLLSRQRSPAAAALLGLSGWAGFGAGLFAAYRLLIPQALGALAAMGPDTAFELTAATGMAAKGMVALGIAGACAPIVAVLAGASREALLRTLMASLLMPGAAVILGALTTPPDVVSQLAVASLVGASWVVGLGVGAMRLKLAG